jgi:hypothetical protein
LKDKPLFKISQATTGEIERVLADVVTLQELFLREDMTKQQVLNAFVELLSTMLVKDFPQKEKRESIIDAIGETIKQNTIALQKESIQ